jgi:hypothetical protein
VVFPFLTSSIPSEVCYTSTDTHQMELRLTDAFWGRFTPFLRMGVAREEANK